VDYVVVNHAEQDHSGSLPIVLSRYPRARVLATSKCRELLGVLLGVTADRVDVVAEGDTLALGGRTLRFIDFPWVHWPETMLTLAVEDGVLFTGDLFGSHLAVSDVRAADASLALAAAKEYYALIMMPFRGVIARNLWKIPEEAVRLIAPTHGPLWAEPARVLDAYRRWIDERPENAAVIPYASMHDSTRHMVLRLGDGLVARGVSVELVPLANPDLGQLATALVDAATIVLGSPTVLAGAHPQVAYAAFLANALRPKAHFASVVGSYGWGGKMLEQLTGILANLTAEFLPPVIVRGAPRGPDLAALDALAGTIADRHRTLLAG
jgi:flavorubredoxin